MRGTRTRAWLTLPLCLVMACGDGESKQEGDAGAPLGDTDSSVSEGRCVFPNTAGWKTEVVVEAGH